MTSGQVGYIELPEIYLSIESGHLGVPEILSDGEDSVVVATEPNNPSASTCN